MDVNDSFRYRLRSYRQDLGLSLRELGEKTSLSPGYISHLETGRRQPTDENIEVLSKALNIKPEQLFVAIPRDNEARASEAFSIIKEKESADFEVKRHMIPRIQAEEGNVVLNFNSMTVGLFLKTKPNQDFFKHNEIRIEPGIRHTIEMAYTRALSDFLNENKDHIYDKVSEQFDIIIENYSNRIHTITSLKEDVQHKAKEEKSNQELLHELEHLRRLYEELKDDYDKTFVDMLTDTLERKNKNNTDES